MDENMPSLEWFSIWHTLGQRRELQVNCPDIRTGRQELGAPIRVFLRGGCAAQGVVGGHGGQKAARYHQGRLSAGAPGSPWSFGSDNTGYLIAHC
jgi:hypothetical protein